MKTKSTQIIRDFEKLKLTAYLPTKDDVWTIGYGHTKGVKPGMTITEEQAEIYLKEDVKWAEDAVNKLVKVKLNQNQFDALVSFVFNIGESQFSTSTMLRKLNVGDYEGASNEFPRWNKQKGKVLNGLIRRREMERTLFLTPTFSRVSEAVGGAVVAGGGSMATLVTQDTNWTVIAIVGAVIAIVAFLGIRQWRK